ncbi:protein tyrosine phosphatase [Cotesia plutellae polydnavirus]|nr:protein tyrosine phosphatase [Cotesia plutellae polydnavirus]
MNTKSVQNFHSSSRRQRHIPSTKKIKFDPSASFVDGNNITKKFMIFKESASNISFPEFWDLIWKTGSKVIVRFDKGKSMKHSWLNSSSSLEYSVGRYTLWKKTMIDKYYTQINLTVRNDKENKSRKIIHYQYHDVPDDQAPFYSTQFICFWKMVNQRHEDCILEGAKGKKKAFSPIVMYSAKCFERLVSICVIDICLDQLTEEQPVSVTKTLTNIKSQLFLQLISSDEEEFVKKTLQHIQRLFVWRKGEDNNSGLEIKSFRNRVRKYCLLFKRKSVG